ncbi:MAG: hypothetical protein DDT21_02636 [Syntrophomonadaceae bacterium]|nr:hypothetical protein [Bacillota bacterium]
MLIRSQDNKTLIYAHLVYITVNSNREHILFAVFEDNHTPIARYINEAEAMWAMDAIYANATRGKATDLRRMKKEI